jgi:branched-chain amino acid transport system ATP-binding protein
MSGLAMTGTTPAGAAPLLRITGLCKRFGGLTALDGLDLELWPGEVLGLIGPNGSGKTTLFNVVSGALPADGGRIEYQGRPLLGLRPHQVCRLGLARTFQITKPFPNLSTRDNVLVGAFNRTRDPRAAGRVADEVLAFVGLAAQGASDARALTVPQRKRLELARALATRPRLLLLDEVMAGLTPREHDDLIELIARIRAQGVTLFVIEHAMKVIMSISDRVAVIHQGRKIAVGAPREVARDARVIEAYLGEEYRFAGAP